MSATASQPPMPRQPIGTTFVVSMSLLGLIAVIQVLAVLVAVVPRYAEVASRMLKERAISESTASPAQPTPEPQAAPIRPLQEPASGQQVQQLLTEAGTAYRLGDFEGALKTVEEVEVLAPGDYRVLLLKAAVMEKLDQPAEAVLLLEQAMKSPGLPAESRASVKKKIDMLAESIGTTQPAPGKSRANTGVMPEGGGQRMADANGIPAGASLGIIDVRTKDLKRGKKTLSVSVKSMPNADIAGEKVKILAYFYEQNEDGEIVLTESPIENRWMSPPIDWAENEPEILDLEYTLPEATGADGGRKYTGYVVGLYYNGELQDYRSDPPMLSKRHPLPLDDTQ